MRSSPCVRWPLAIACLASLAMSLATSAQIVDPLPFHFLEPEDPIAAGDENRNLGFSVAIWRRTAFVGAPGDDQERGAVYVFNQNRAGSWVYASKLVAPQRAVRNRFGNAIALRDDRALIAAPGEAAVYAFELHRKGWVLEQTLRAGTGAPNAAFFGAAVAVTACAAAIGATPDPNTDPPVIPGTVYVFDGCHGHDNDWRRVARLTSADSLPADRFASSVALTDEWLIVGAPAADSRGAAYLFRHQGKQWRELQKVAAADLTQGAGFGAAVALQGRTAFIGAPRQDVTSPASAGGAVYVFVRAGRDWGEHQKVQPLPGQAPEVEDFASAFGASVDIAGNRLAIGAPGGNLARVGGAAFFYERLGAFFELRAVEAGGNFQGGFGFSVGITSRTMLVGDPFSTAFDPDLGFIAAGEALAFVLPPPFEDED